MVHKFRAQIVRATEFCVVAPNVCVCVCVCVCVFGLSVWNLLRATFLAIRVLRHLVNVWEICASFCL